ncbi:MAG: V-type ATP synthase subunit D [Candidatus Omnitrophica bacterium]|nr:V-type ATP synthase subunit D [Candidatus Omnitrophota bacterium]
MRLAVNPNRMEILKLRRRLIYAQRGAHLLEDKLQELLIRFNDILKRTLELEEKLNFELNLVFRNLFIGRIFTKRSDLISYLKEFKIPLFFKATEQSFMNIKIPSLKLEIPSFVYPLSLKVSLDIELGIKRLVEILPQLFLLVQQVKTVQILAKEIESCRRRVNALNYILIPSIIQTIRYIGEKLTELERASLLRLMRIKEILQK